MIARVAFLPIFLIIILLLISPSLARSIYLYDFYDISVNPVFPEKNVYKAGEEINFSVKIENKTGYVLKGTLVYALVYGSEKPFSSSTTELSEGQAEAIVGAWYKDIFIPPAGEKNVPLNVKIPADARGGTWRIDVYLMGYRIPLFGNYVSYSPGAYWSFRVEGDGSNPPVLVLRNKTFFAGSYLQSGPSADANTLLPGRLVIRNISEKTFAGSVEVFACKFDDYFDRKCVKIAEGKINAAPGNEGVYDFVAKLAEPGAYSIVYKISGQDTKIFYKNRVIINEMSPRVLDMTLNSSKIYKGETYEGRVVLTGPFFPATGKTRNIDVKITVKDKNAVFFENVYRIEELNTDSIKVIFFSFTAEKDSKFPMLCVEYEGEEECVSLFSTTAINPKSTAEREGWGYTLLAGGAVLLILLVAFFVMRKRKGVIALVLILLLAGAFAEYTCPGFKYYYDSNRNGRLDSGDKDITEYIQSKAVGNKVYLPLGTIIATPGTCTVKNIIHWCSNTAVRESTYIYDHKLTVLTGGDMVFVVDTRYDTSSLQKYAIIWAIWDNTYLLDQNGENVDYIPLSELEKYSSWWEWIEKFFGWSEEENVENPYGLDSSDINLIITLRDYYGSSKYVPSYSVPKEEQERLEKIMMEDTLSNLCADIGCKYEKISSSLGKIETNTHVYYVFWEKVFTDLYNIGYISTVTEGYWKIIGEAKTLAEKVEYFVISEPGNYVIKHTY